MENIKKDKENKSILESIKKSIKKISFNLNRLSIKEQTFFAKRLSFLIKAGIPMRESLVMIREQTSRKGYGIILDTVIDNISNGQSLSASLGRFKNTFGEFTINIINFGEQSGILSENLEYIAEELRKKQALRKKIISASIYPIVVTIATLGITTFLMLFLFPKIMPIFTSIHMDLPVSTLVVINITNFVENYGLLCVCILLAIFISSMVAIKKNKTYALYFDKFLLKLPIAGKIIRDYNLANFTRTMGILLKSGVTLGEALPISATTTSNLVYKQEFKSLASVVNRGSKISLYLSKQKNLFPGIVPQIISAGEHSGNLSDSLIYLSEMYEAEVDNFTKNLSTLVEPVLMIVMGFMVGFIAISIITPIYGITQHLQVK